MLKIHAKSNVEIGSKVRGSYLGEFPFTGTLIAVRATPDGRNMILTLDLDNPIKVYGSWRERIEIWTNDSAGGEVYA